jgi:16S rRNA (cytidine1402-2'-O)-methyltransferase
MTQNLEASTLYLVATPIGHLQDITLRALEVLRQADAILCEDTRRTRILLKAHGIRNRLVSFHAHNEARRIPQVLRRLRAGAALALVSDAGMPGLSDPGERLVRAVWDAGGQVRVVPGPSAVVAALAMSGLPTQPFAFWGFLPRREADRLQLFERWARWPATHIAFETGRRLLKTLDSLHAWRPGQAVCLIKELTKVHERRYLDTPDRLKAHFQAKPDETAGEWVLLVHVAEPTGEAPGVETPRMEVDLPAMYRDLVAAGLKPRAAVRLLARWTGQSANVLYERMRRREGR